MKKFNIHKNTVRVAFLTAMILFIILLSTSSQAALTDGLIAYYKMENATTGYQTSEIMPYGTLNYSLIPIGTPVQNTSTTGCKQNNCVSMRGSGAGSTVNLNSYQSGSGLINVSASNNHTVCVSYWTTYQAGTTAGVWEFHFGAGGATDIATAYQTNTSSGGGYNQIGTGGSTIGNFQVGTTGVHNVISCSNDVTDKTTAWVDGVLVFNNVSNAGAFGVNPRVMFKGAQNGQWGAIGWSTFDEVGIWIKQLSSAEVAQLSAGDNTSFYPFTPAASPDNTTASHLSLLSRNPADLAVSSAFTYTNFTLTYQYFNTTNLSLPYYANYTLVSTLNDCAIYVNGTCEMPNGRLLNRTPSIISANNSNQSVNVTYTFTENDLFPHTENFEVLNITQYALVNNTYTGANDWHKEEFLNVTTQNKNYTLVIETPLNTTGLAHVYIANSSFTETTNIATNPNVAEICSITSTMPYNHTHNNGQYGHHTCVVNVQNGSFNGVRITNKMFVLHHNEVGNLRILAISNTTRTNSSRQTLNGGTTWSNAFNIVSHIHFLSSQDYVQFSAHALMKNGTKLSSSIINDTLQNDVSPPNNPTLTFPVGGQNVNASVNITYMSAGPTVYYNLTLLNSDLTINRSIVQNNSANLFYLWNAYLESEISLGTYFIQVVAKNSNGTTIDIEEFNLTRNAVINVTARAYQTNLSINSFSVNVTDTLEDYVTTTGSILVNTVRGINITLNTTAANYTSNLTSVFTPSNAQVVNLSLILYGYNSIIIRFYDEITGNIINFTTVYLELISDIFANNYTATNGTLFVNLLNPTTYTSRYSASGYTERFYSFTLNADTYQFLNLYLLNDSFNTSVTITVYDQTTLPLENATVKALKYDILTNTYYIVEICTTNIEGKCLMDLTLNDEFYKFIVEYNGETVKTTTPAYITSTSLTIQVVIGESILQNYLDWESIDYALSWDASNERARVFYNDVDNIGTRYCLRTWRSSALSSTMLAENCSTVTTSILYLNVNRTYGESYTAHFYYTASGVEIKLASLTIPSLHITLQEDTQQDMLWLQIFASLILLIIVITTGAAWLLPVLLPLSLVFGRAMGINSFDYPVLFGFVMLGIIITFWMREARQ